MSRPHSKEARGPQKTHSMQANSGGDFLFNKTSLLSSALQKLNKTYKTSAPKRVNEEPIPLPGQNPTKKVKVSAQVNLPTLAYTPLQKDLFNFYTINKVSLKNFQIVPEPKLEAGSQVLTAICDRGIGGKYLVTNLFRNKKAYIDYTEVPLQHTNEQSAIEALEAYQSPGDFVVGGVTKPRSTGKIQLSLSQIEEVNQKELRIGQVLVGQIKSKEQLGCHLKVKGLKKMKAFMPKGYLSEQTYEQLVENKQILVTIKQIDEGKHLVKVILISEEQIPLNLRGIEEAEMSKFQLEHYVAPGTLLNTKIVKVLPNGLLVKFLKIFLGFIHADHLDKNIKAYVADEKILARVIYSCNNPPTLFLSEKHKNLSIYHPKRPLYSAVAKPESLNEIQHSYLNTQHQFFVHPLQLHSEIENVNKFWVKENNYFEKYQIMSSTKIGVQVGDVAKVVPFENFKVYGKQENQDQDKVGKFRVMCLDVWSKVIKISYDQGVIKAKNLLMDIENVDENQQYCGFISNVNINGVVVEFCNNIKGIISQRELQLNNQELTEANIGEAINVYVANLKKNYLGLSIIPPQLRKSKKDAQNTQKDKKQNDSTSVGIIQSVNSKSIHPIYVKIKNKLIKVNIFQGIRPASLDDLPIIQDLEGNFTVGDKVQVFHKYGKYYLYPPEQLSDKNLRFCRIISVQGNSLRVQTNENQFRNCHICDITDLISPHPLHEYQIGEYTIGRIVNEKLITLRKSLVLNGLPENMKQVVERHAEQQKRGDFRARIEAVGPSALKLQTVVFGYIKSFSDKGCFISLCRNFDVRVDKSELSDHFIPNKEHIFIPNKLVLCRLINSKVATNHQNMVQIDASLRESVVKFGYPLNDQILETGVGLTVKGIVTGYTKGKALVRLESSRLTGIIALKDYEQAQESETLEKVLPIGKELICKVIEYSREGEKRLIRLATKSKFFKKYEGLQTTFDCDKRITQLWDNFQTLSSIEAPQRESHELEGDENKEEAEYQRLKKLLADNKIQIENDNEEQEEEQQQMEEEPQEQREQELEPEEEEQEEDQMEVEEVSEESEQNKKEKEITQKSEMQRKVAQFQPLPHPKEFYQSLVLANPTPESYLLYISSLLPTASPPEVRNQFQKAISSLTDIKDKDNMWISWLNTELILGDFTGTVKKAVEANVGPAVHFRIMQILYQQQNWPVALEFGKKTLKKFNRDPKAYISFLKMLNEYQRTGHQIPESLSTKQIMRRANQCLKSNEVIQIQIHHAKSLFESKQAEQGRNVFENLVTSHPRRSDLWSVYIAQEIKHENVDKARHLLERALSIGLKKKSTISLLKKYLQIEKSFGTEASVAKIIERAKALASSYQHLDDQQDQIEDIQ